MTEAHLKEIKERLAENKNSISCTQYVSELLKDISALINEVESLKKVIKFWRKQAMEQPCQPKK